MTLADTMENQRATTLVPKLRVKDTVYNNGIYYFPNGNRRLNTCFIKAITDALDVNNIEITDDIKLFIAEFVEIIVEIFGWDTFVNTHDPTVLKNDNDFNRFTAFLTEHFQKNTNCCLGIIGNMLYAPLIFGPENKKIIWICQEGWNHYEAVKEFF